MKIAIYSRKSKYTGVGDSIENQVQMCKDYANAKYMGQALEFDVYEDEGFSGRNLIRPEFQKLINNINEYDILMCYKLDRISRNVADFSSTLEVLQGAKCDFVSIKENFDTSTPMGRAMIHIASVFAQLERETIAERVKDNMLELAKNGRWSGGRTPLGYKSEPVQYIDEEGNERKAVKLVQDQEELELVKLIYDTYLKQGSLHKTEVWFTQNKIKSNSGVLLEKTSLKIILQNPVYVRSTDKVIEYLNNNDWNVYGEADGVHGLLTYNKTESVAGSNGKVTKRVQNKENWIAAVSNVEGIIDADTWIRVQEQFKKNKDTFPRLGKTHTAILTGKLRCKKCENYMLVQHGRTSVKTGEKIYYYTCSLKRKSKGELCNCKNIKAAEIEPAVLKLIEDLASNKEDFKNMLREKNSAAKLDNDIVSKRNALEKQIADKEKQITGLVDKLSLDDSIADILINRIKSYKSEIETLKADILNINSKIEESNNYKLAESFLDGFFEQCKDISSQSKEKQRQLINSYVNYIEYDDDTEEAALKLYEPGELKKN